jgi:hypothetical protein
MRSIKLRWAPAAIAASVAVLFPAAASAGLHASRHAERHAAGTAGCHVQINVAPRFIQAGEATVVFGELTCPTQPPAGQTVTVYGQPVGGPPASALGTTTTDEHGNYSFTTPALQSNSRLYAIVYGVQSGRRSVKVSPKVTMTTAPPDGSQLFTGGGPFIRSHLRRHGLSNRVVFAGSVSPSDQGATVALQRESSVGNEEWHRIGKLSTVGQGGTYSIAHTFAVPGEANIRVVIRSHRLYAPAASESVSYEISQAQNPALTIESSADPISYGQPVTVSGTIEAPPSSALTLLARNRLQHDFVPVATTRSTAATTGTGSVYSFPVQTPTQSTFYEVTGAGKSSSRLFEGVRYGVTASASASNVAAGQPVTFSGTVTPSHAGEPTHEGHPVYLQALGGAGVGYHTVEVAKVKADGTFTIAHAFYTAGMRQLRVKVPGDPENQGAATLAVPLEVTPAPAATLTPEAPGNSTQPAEGHL